MEKEHSNAKFWPAGLLYFEGQDKPRQYVVFSRTRILGQSEMEIYTTSSLQLKYPFLDKEQCEIYQRDGKWYYKNLSEEVFTFVGGKVLKKDGEAPLTDGTVIRLSNERMLTLIFYEKFARSTDWEIINMDDGRHVVEIENVSQKTREYVRLIYNGGRWNLEGMKVESIYFNGKKITEPTPIQIDDYIQIGDTKFIFEGSGLVYGYPTMTGGLSIQIDERSVHNALKKVVLLKDINLSIEPGSMVLILGGSGAGKSTFVNAVTGYEKAKATIREDDIDYYLQYEQVKHRIGFVPQDNLLREEDTVGDTVKNAAEMRLPDNMSAQEKNQRVREVLETFGLSGREGELVSKLSGGQKKRLSICIEFVANPSLFILDEPDSGLDGIMATELMENLRLIACQGKMVLVITHSPDRVAHLFDKVIVLAKGGEDRVGQLAFYGEIQEARDFFGTATMEGIVKLINAVNEGGDGRADEFIEKYKVYEQERGQKVRDVFQDSTAGMEEDVEDEGLGPQDFTHYKGRLAQIPVYLGKLFRLFITEKNWKVLPMSAIIAFLVVYVLGRSMFRNMEGTAYGSLAVICVCIWNGMFNSIQSVCKERSIIKREHRTGLHISSYLAAHLIYQAFICFLQVLITLLIFLLGKVHLPEAGLMTGSFLLDLGICMFLATYASDMLALMISCIVKSPTAAMTVMPFLLIVQLVFAGTVFPLNRRMAQRLSNFSISHWGITAVCTASDYNSQNSTVLTLAVNKMQGQEDDLVTKIKDVVNLPEVNEKLRTYTASKLQNSEYEYSRKNLGRCWAILALFSAMYAFVGLLFLENVDRDSR